MELTYREFAKKNKTAYAFDTYIENDKIKKSHEKEKLFKRIIVNTGLETSQKHSTNRI